MDASEVRAIVDKYAPPLMAKLGIPHWTIAFTYDMREAKGDFAKRGECIRQLRYDRATIRFDCEEFATEAEVLQVLRHELIHVVLAPFDLFWHAASAHWNGDPVKAEVMDAIWDHAVEQAVIRVERACEGHLDPELRASTSLPRPKRSGRRHDPD